MRTHRGMRPHDIIILLKMSHTDDTRQKALSEQLYMSQSEISDSLSRSQMAVLVDSPKKQVLTKNLMEYLIYGIKYSYPCIPGRIRRGMPTGHSAAPLSQYIQSDQHYVWPDAKGIMMGQSIEPLHPNQHLAAREDAQLYQKLSLVDAIRLRSPRETMIAIEELTKLFGL